MRPVVRHRRLPVPEEQEAAVEDETGKGTPRIVGGPSYVEWLNAIRTGTPALSNFASSGPFSETVLLGNLALRVGKRIQWDAKKMAAKNAPELTPT